MTETLRQLKPETLSDEKPMLLLAGGRRCSACHAVSPIWCARNLRYSIHIGEVTWLD